jgi:hypothetical protein
MASKIKADNVKVKVVKTPEQKQIEKLAKDNQRFRDNIIKCMNDKRDSFVVHSKKDFQVWTSDAIDSSYFGSYKVYMKINGQLMYLKNIEDAYTKVRFKLLEYKNENNYNRCSISKSSYSSGWLGLTKYLTITTRFDGNCYRYSTETTKVYLIENGKFRSCKSDLMFKIGSVEYDKIQAMLNKPMNELSINEINTLSKHKLMPESAKDKEIKELKDTVYELNLRIQSNFGMNMMMNNPFGCCR